MKKIAMVLATLSLSAATLIPTSSVLAQTKGIQTPQHHKIFFHLRRRFGPVEISQGTITAINGTTLSVSKNGVVYAVDTNSRTAFFRRFFGKSSLSEMNVGDLVNVRGQFEAGSSTMINADFVRDTSIQERHDRFSGTVTSVTSTGLTVKTLNRGTLTVTVDSTAKLKDKNGNSISLGNIQSGDQVILDGVWDRTAHAIFDLTWLRDLSIPR